MRCSWKSPWMRPWKEALLVLALCVAAGLGLGSPHVHAASSGFARELAEIESLAIRGQSDAALDGYRSLLERGLDFPALRYNLGTLYLEQGDVGRAVLHLRTALRDDPGLEDARYNLERALAARADELAGAPRAPGLLLRLAERVSSTTASLLSGGALLALVLLFGLWPWTAPRTVLRRALGTAMVVALVAFAASAPLFAARVYADGREEAVLLDDEVSARVAPSVDAAVAFVAHAGLYGEVVAEEAGFLRLRLENGLDAWFPRASLGRVGDTKVP